MFVLQDDADEPPSIKAKAPQALVNSSNSSNPAGAAGLARSSSSLNANQL
jgi:hypothetical protein